MMQIEMLPIEQECFEYHGSTIVERVQHRRGSPVVRYWLLFDTAEEAEDYYNENREIG
jgi:hypothetical protein